MVLCLISLTSEFEMSKVNISCKVLFIVVMYSFRKVSLFISLVLLSVTLVLFYLHVLAL